MITAHASPELLAAHAAGSLSEGMRLAVATHLAFCAACRGAVGLLEAVGGVLLAEAEAAPVPRSCRDGALARIACPAPRGAIRPPLGLAGRPLPAPLRARLGTEIADAPWRPLRPGLFEVRLEGFGGEDVRLVRGEAGVGVPAHAHLGEEATLVLAGRLRDGDRVYAAGDLALAGEADEHEPRILGPESCLCLVVLSAPIRLIGAADGSSIPFS